ncbi:MAG: phosphotransferase [Planctomycetota bacterium]
MTPEHPWHAERTLTEAVVTPWILEAAPWLAGADVRAFSSGWDNAAFLVGEDLVVRFPRRRLAVDLLEVETRVLPHLVGRLSVRVPAPELVGRSPDEQAWPFVGYRLLPGTTACRAGLGEDERAGLAAPQGHFLGGLHTIDVAEARAFGAGGDVLGRVEPTERGERALDALAEAATEGWLQASAVSVLGRMIASVLDAEPEPRATALCHGDLYARHLLVEDGRLTGVIDWGDVHVGDPAVDLAVSLAFLPHAARPAFERAYAARAPLPDQRGRLLARLRAIGHSLTLLQYGQRGAEPELAFEARRTLHLLAQEFEDPESCSRGPGRLS